MYKDVMSPRAFGRYNIYLVQLIGLAAAVYWEQLYSISDLAYSKCERNISKYSNSKYISCNI